MIKVGDSVVVHLGQMQLHGEVVADLGEFESGNRFLTVKLGDEFETSEIVFLEKHLEVVKSDE